MKIEDARAALAASKAARGALWQRVCLCRRVLPRECTDVTPRLECVTHQGDVEVRHYRYRRAACIAVENDTWTASQWVGDPAELRRDWDIANRVASTEKAELQRRFRVELSYEEQWRAAFAKKGLAWPGFATKRDLAKELADARLVKGKAARRKAMAAVEPALKGPRPYVGAVESAETWARTQRPDRRLWGHIPSPETANVIVLPCAEAWRVGQWCPEKCEPQPATEPAQKHAVHTATPPLKMTPEAEAWLDAHPETRDRTNRRWGAWDSTPASGTRGRPRHEDAGREPSAKKSRRKADVYAELTGTDAACRRFADIANARAVAGLMPPEIRERIELEQDERYDATNLRHLGLVGTVDPHAGTFFGRVYQAGVIDDGLLEAGERLHEFHWLLFNGYPTTAACYDVLGRVDCGRRVGVPLVTADDDDKNREHDFAPVGDGDPIALDQDANLEVREQGPEPEIEVANPYNHYALFGDDPERDRARERLDTVQNFVTCACGDDAWHLLKAAYADNVPPSDDAAVIQLILALSMAFAALSDPAPIRAQAIREFRNGQPRRTNVWRVSS